MLVTIFTARLIGTWHGWSKRWKPQKTCGLTFSKILHKKGDTYGTHNEGLFHVVPWNLQADRDTADIPTIVYGTNKALAAVGQNNEEELDYFDIMYISKIMDTLLPYAATDKRVSCTFFVLYMIKSWYNYGSVIQLEVYAYP